jgi:hypothetical protein
VVGAAESPDLPVEARVRRHLHLTAGRERPLLAIGARPDRPSPVPHKASAQQRLYGGTRTGRWLKRYMPLNGRPLGCPRSERIYTFRPYGKKKKT